MRLISRAEDDLQSKTTTFLPAGPYLSSLWLMFRVVDNRPGSCRDQRGFAVSCEYRVILSVKDFDQSLFAAVLLRSLSSHIVDRVGVGW